MELWIDSFSVVVPLAILFLLTAVRYFQNASRKRKFPPGPPLALPVIGNLLQLGTKPHLTFQQWRKKYGPVFSFQMGAESAVVVSNGKLVRELFSKGAAAGRPRSEFFKMFGQGQYGVLNAEGKTWEQQRRFTIRTLKELGVSHGRNTSIEGILLDEAQAVVDFFERNEGKPVAVTRVFNWAVVSTLWTIVSGERNKWGGAEEPEFLKAAAEFMDSINYAVSTGLFFVPWLRHVAPKWSGWTDYVRCTRNFEAVADKVVAQHVAARDPSCAKDFIDHYLGKIEETNEPRSSFFKQEGLNNLKMTLLDLLLTGNESTAATLEYGMLYLTQNPRAQEKLQMELDRVIGSSRPPSLSDLPSLPYAEATIQEILRLSCIAPMGALHKLLEDVELSGWFLPKGTNVLADFYNILHDPETWGPDAIGFRPERFLDEDETEVVVHEDMIPFSVGKRACIGESLSKDNIFLFMASILQKFWLEAEPDGRVVDPHDCQPGLVLKLKPFKLVFKLRDRK